MKKPKHVPELISEGCKSYHRALYAVMQFRKQVQEIIRAAVDDHFSDLATALALAESEIELADYASPSQFQSAFDGSEAEVGLKCEYAGWGLYYYIWVGEEEEAYFAASCWLKGSSASIAKLSNPADEELWIDEDDEYVHMFSYFPSEGSVDLVAICEKVLGRWIEFWTKVGGIQQFLLKPKKKKATSL
jgi:hypothetical protein